jgi:hypothetical protein
MKIAIETKRDAGERRGAKPKGDVEGIHTGSLAEPLRPCPHIARALGFLHPISSCLPPSMCFYLPMVGGKRPLCLRSMTDRTPRSVCYGQFLKTCDVL